MNKLIVRFVPALCLALILVSSTASAEKDDKQDEPAAEQVLKVDYEDIESIGLVSKADEGSLGRDLWKGTDRSALVKLLEVIPASSKAPAAQRLINGILLSETQAERIDNDIEPEPGRDIFTLRMEKLLEGGAYRQAFEMYNVRDGQDPYHERLARTGILAAMFNGEKSVACLDSLSLNERFDDIAFWKTVTQYCEASLSETAEEDSVNSFKSKVLQSLSSDKNYKFPYTPESFGKLTDIEQAALAAEHKISFDGSASDVPPRHVQILLRQPDLPANIRFALTLKGTNYGILKVADLADLYTAGASPASGQEQSAINLDELEDWEKLSQLYVSAKNAPEGEEQWQIIRKSFSLKKKYGITALLPFANTVSQLKPENITAEEVATAFEAMAYANLTIPAQWIDIAEKISLDDANDATRYKLLTAAYISRLNRSKDDEERQKVFASAQKISPHWGQLTKNIMKIVDKRHNNSDNADAIYEKDVDFAFKNDYVMPSMELWDRLKKAREKQSIGETVLLSATALDQAPLTDMYPWLFGDVLTSLDQVGLTDISRKMAMQAVLSGDVD